MIYVIEDDEYFARCLARYCRPLKTRVFSNVIEAVNAIDEDFPELIFLDVMLTGPDGFTLLNELMSYPDTAKIPIVIVSSINFLGRDLSSYGVVGVLNKDLLTPREVKNYVERYTHKSFHAEEDELWGS